MEIEVFQKVAGLKNSHPAPPVLEHSALPLDLVLYADVVVLLLLRLVALPHAVLRLDLEVELGVAVHHRALLDQPLQGTDLHRNPEGTVGQERKRTSDFGLSARGLLLLLGQLVDHRERLDGFLGGELKRLLILVVLLPGDVGPGLLVGPLLVLDLAPDEGEEMGLAAEEEGVAEDILAGILAGLVEAVHIELPDEAIDVPVSEVFGEDVFLEFVDLLDGKLAAVAHPVDNGLVLFVLEDLEALLDEVGH